MSRSAASATPPPLPAAAAPSREDKGKGKARESPDAASSQQSSTATQGAKPAAPAAPYTHTQGDWTAVWNAECALIPPATGIAGDVLTTSWLQAQAILLLEQEDGQDYLDKSGETDFMSTVASQRVHTLVPGHRLTGMAMSLDARHESSLADPRQPQLQRKEQLQVRTHRLLAALTHQAPRKASPRGHSSRHCPARARQLRQLHNHLCLARHLLSPL